MTGHLEDLSTATGPLHEVLVEMVMVLEILTLQALLCITQGMKGGFPGSITGLTTLKTTSERETGLIGRCHHHWIGDGTEKSMTGGRLYLLHLDHHHLQ